MNAAEDDTNITLVNAAARLLLAWIIAAIALTACDEKTTAQTPTPTPLAGWDRARWGMTASEIRTAYPAAKPQERKTSDDGSYCDLTLGTTIVGYDFTVHFVMDKADKLAAVQLAKKFEKETDGTQDITAESAYTTVKDLLIQKYGRPVTEKQPEPRYHFRSFNSVWHVSNAKITLSYISVPLTGFCSIFLNYEKPGDTDKL